jgi:predicted Fe-Mo cluster-binding NifX family protein
MSEQEQKFVTSLMTSGYPHDLCQAATILCGIANLLRDGKLVVSNNNHTTNTPSSSSSSTRPRSSAVLSHGYSNAGVRTNRSSLNEHETQKTKHISNYQREAEQKARDRIRRPLPARMPLCVALRTSEFEKIALLQQQQEEVIKNSRNIQQHHAQLAKMADQSHRPPPHSSNESLPLGSRWGKWLKTGAKTLVASVGYDTTGTSGSNCGVNMTFVDDEWDGSIADAFARAQVVSVAAPRNKGQEGVAVVSNEGEKGGGGGGATTTTLLNTTSNNMMIVKGRIGPRSEIEKEGVNRILAESSRTAALDGRPPFRTKRVLVASVRGQAGKCGIMKGDVITHVNGEEFTGTANDLRSVLIRAYEEQGHDGIVMLVVNAEECTAEALRLRSRIR